MTAEREILQKSSRDLGQTRAGLAAWLAGKLPGGSAHEVTELTAPSTGQSSETLFFTAAWHDGSDRQARRLVARVAPRPVDMPVFPSYQMEREFQVIRLVRELTSVPVPEAIWVEPDPAALGTPFYIMSRVDGDVPDDIMYSSEGWLFEASRAEQRRVQEATVSALAALHAVPDPERNFAFLQYPQAGEDALRRHVAHAQAWYDYAVSLGGRCPLIERGFRRLAQDWPADPGETVLSWGDARVNNVIYRDFAPAALLDWEMAGLGPREIDIAWLVGGHRVFQDIAGLFGSPGMPHFLRLEDVVAQYEAATGHRVRDIGFYLMYTAIQWAIVFVIVGLRRVRFGEQPMPDDIHDLVINRGALEQMLAGGPLLPEAQRHLKHGSAWGTEAEPRPDRRRDPAVPVPMDEYPIHQLPLSLEYVGTGDRNFYDRCYFAGHDRTGDILLITGLGVYPNLGVTDAYATVRRGDRQWAVRFSDALGTDRLNQRVGPYRIEVIEPLRRIRLACDGDEHGIGFDLTWDGSFPAVHEAQHVSRNGPRLFLDASRFAQLGTWAGVLRVGGDEIAVDPARWTGARDRSWGLRPVGEPEPPGRPAEPGFGGFWWVYSQLRFDDYAIVLLAQEETDGYRTANDAVRIWGDGRREQLGWPEFDIRYRPGTRHPEHAAIHLRTRGGKQLTVEAETLTSVALHVGAGYSGDPEWSHGQWKGRNWASGAVYDLNDPAVAGRVPYGVIDHACRATCDGAEGWGIFEHATIGRHEPSGFADAMSVAT